MVIHHLYIHNIGVGKNFLAGKICIFELFQIIEQTFQYGFQLILVVIISKWKWTIHLWMLFMNSLKLIFIFFDLYWWFLQKLANICRNFADDWEIYRPLNNLIIDFDILRTQIEILELDIFEEKFMFMTAAYYQ